MLKVPPVLRYFFATKLIITTPHYEHSWELIKIEHSVQVKFSRIV